MKILIDENISLEAPRGYDDPSGNYYEVEASVQRLQRYLRSLGVYHLVHFTDEKVILTLQIQKIVLKDTAMNSLFSALSSVFEGPFSLRYANLGGDGCEFSLVLVPVGQREGRKDVDPVTEYYRDRLQSGQAALST